MGFRDRNGLKDRANRRLEEASFDPKKLMLVYIGASSLLMLLVTGASYLLQSQIEGTGGLGGIGMRSVLETAMEVIQTLANLVLPFWTMGYLACVLRIVRGQPFDLSDLLTGFRHFGPVARLNILYALQFLLLAFLCFYPCVLVYSMTPLSAPLMEILEPLASATGEVVLDEATTAAATEAMLPLLLLYAVVFPVVAAPRFYNYRMAFFFLLDDPKAGARMALRRSTFAMRGKRVDLLKLDVSFWWFYGLDMLTVALCYGDAILSWLGLPLPVSAEFAYFLFYVLYLAAQVGLYIWARNRVECTYAVGYENLRQEMETAS